MESRRLLKSMARLLDDCKKMRELKQIHSQIITSPYFSKSDNLFLLSRLIFFCAVSSSGSLTYASHVFRVTHNPNLAIYNAMIRAYSCEFTNKDDKPRSLVLYKQMLLNCIIPDCITIPFLLKECGSRLDLLVGQSIHAHSVKFGLHDDVYVRNSMIGFYFACGVLTYACKVFDEMSKRDIVSWNSIIIGGIKKDMPGSSMIEVDGIIYEFSIKGSSEVLVEETKSLLYQLSKEMKVPSRALLFDYLVSNKLTLNPVFLPSSHQFN
ncbi:hypothetical protein L6452_14695 [Arctium lappa]|uniref:Uncharacterized protein n=1 Tax=Arctium lappa TaxID=4217 RepID=A0ACB9CLP6_ARCLA|nr:hypothetical protein L6452_14695 [Arctium lappa]